MVVSKLRGVMVSSRNVLKVLMVAALGLVPMLSHADLVAGKNPSRRSSQRVAAAPAQDNKMMLTPAETDFANQLSPLHRQIFVMVFTPDLRKEAMDMMTIGSDTGEETMMTADMAVEQVISHHRDMSTMPNGQSTTQPSTNAPAKQTQNSGSKKKSYWSS